MHPNDHDLLPPPWWVFPLLLGIALGMSYLLYRLLMLGNVNVGG